MSVVAVLFWLWLAVSVVMLVRRRAARRAAQAEVTPDAEVEAPLTDASELEPEPALVTVPAASAPAPLPLVQAREEALVERRSTRRGVPAAGIAEALVGIRMPCELVPLVVDRLATDRIVLSTTGHPVEAVGTGLADELERLGYVLRPLSERDLLATRGATELLLSIKRPGIDGRHVDHPEARDDAVVVEIALH